MKQYYCTPLNFNIGRFNFVKHQLKLERPEDIKEFEECLEGLAPSARSMIRTISTDAAEKLIAQHKAQAHQGPLGSNVGPERNPAGQAQNIEDLIRGGVPAEEAERIAGNAKADNTSEDMLTLEDTPQPSSISELLNK